MYKIEIINKDTNEVKIYDNLNDLNFGEKKFYRFELNLTDLADGKYIVNLYEDDKLIITDDLNIGNFNVNSLQKKVGENIYISTKTDTKLQEKNVEISDVVTTITPDDGFDAITILNINAQAVRDNAFAEGYESGNTDGYNNGYEVGYNSGNTDGVQSVVDNSVELDINANGTYLTKYTGGEGELINKINVRVEGGLDFSTIGYTQEQTDSLNANYNEGIRYAEKIKNEWTNPMSGYKKFENDFNLRYFPNVNTSSLTDMRYLFSNCQCLTYIPIINTSRVTTMAHCFANCYSLVEVPTFNMTKVTTLLNTFEKCINLKSTPQFYTPQLTTMEKTFSACTSLETVGMISTEDVTSFNSTFDECKSLKTIPRFNTNKVTTFNCTFRNSGITTIPQLDTSSCIDFCGMFWGATSLESLPLLDFGSVTGSSKIDYFFGFSGGKKVTDLGGFKNLKVDWNDNNGSLYVCPNLTYQSLLNVINNLYDFRANGDSTTTKTLKLHSNGYNLLTEDDFAVANGKGWNITK